MKVEKINFLSSIDDSTDSSNHNLNIEVKLENNHIYLVVVATPKNLLEFNG